MTEIESGSFRDRNNRVLYADDRVLRGLSEEAYSNYSRLIKTDFFRNFIQTGKLIQTEQVDSQDKSAEGIDGWHAILQHELIPVISYPYEWSFSMLGDAALLHLDLLSSALDEGMILKDSSSFNIQWKGSLPVHIDIPSFEILKQGEPWVGYRQFCEMFLYPLMLQSYKGVFFNPLLRGRIDGIEADQMNGLMSFRDLFRKGVFTHVYLNSKMQSRYSDSSEDMKGTLASAGFHVELIKANVRKLKKIIGKLRYLSQKTLWAEYADNTSYSDTDGDKKADFVRSAVKTRKPRLTWDLGCNTGFFSKIAAEHSDYVVAMDGDHLAVENLYHVLKAENNTRILPLTSNLADPSPNLGWRGTERKDLLSRGKPDIILCLALVHHMSIASNIPLEEIIDWLRDTGAELVIEFVTRKDEMVRRNF